MPIRAAGARPVHLHEVASLRNGRKCPVTGAVMGRSGCARMPCSWLGGAVTERTIDAACVAHVLQDLLTTTDVRTRTNSGRTHAEGPWRRCPSAAPGPGQARPSAGGAGFPGPDPGRPQARPVIIRSSLAPAWPNQAGDIPTFGQQRITRGTIPGCARASCTDSTGNRTGGTRGAGIIRRTRSTNRSTPKVPSCIVLLLCVTSLKGATPEHRSTRLSRKGVWPEAWSS